MLASLGGKDVFRLFLVAPLCLCLFTSGARAQAWAQKLFGEFSHDFGTVARAAKSEYVFEMKNPFKETIHIASVRASCGCSTPTVLDDTLETWEKGGIHVRYNTRNFTGNRSATITVVIDQPYYAEVQLQIKGYIRSDVVIHPSVVEFESVDAGTAAQRQVTVNYAGRSDWEIVDVRSGNTNFEVEITKANRIAGRVDYELVVRLKERMPAGYFNDQLVLVTNDRRSQQIPVRVEGNVLAGLTVSPASLFLGVVKPGDKVTKTIVVKGKQPFKIRRVKCADGCFEFKPSTESKNLHVVPVTFTAASTPGKIAQTIEIETDMGSAGVATCVATATVEEGAEAVDEPH
jgi:hypothetical protein